MQELLTPWSGEAWTSRRSEDRTQNRTVNVLQWQVITSSTSSATFPKHLQNPAGSCRRQPGCSPVPPETSGFLSEGNMFLGLKWETLTLHVLINLTWRSHLVGGAHAACRNNDNVKLEKKQLGRKTFSIFYTISEWMNWFITCPANLDR